MTELTVQARAPRNIYLAIAGHLAGELEIQSALAAVAGEIGAVLPFTHADICLHDAPGWTVSYEVGAKTLWSRKRTRLQNSPVRDLLTGKVDMMLTPNAMEDSRFTFPGARCEPIFQHEMRSRVHVPMKVMGRTIGSLNISHTIEALYDADTVALARNIADMLSPYFHALRTAERAQQAALVKAEAQAREEGLRQGALELTQALEQERQRIGMDLHDQTLADLTRLLRELTSEEAPPPAEMLATRLSDCIGDLRRIIDTAVPSLLELFGFAHAVRVHLERSVEAATTEIDVRDRTDGAPDRLDVTTRTALFRITQEAINNAARHAGATQIWVDILRDTRGLVVAIQDDGRGIDLDKTARQSGLNHMRTRARLISAELTILPNDGTTVEIALPSEVLS
ncbi:MAG: GAF domain-containing sensor histidine kinase [Pseudomonadota bacterium]